MIGKVDPEHQVDTTSVCFLQDDNNRCAEVSASFEGSFLDRYEILGKKARLSLSRPLGRMFQKMEAVS